MSDDTRSLQSAAPAELPGNWDGRRDAALCLFPERELQHLDRNASVRCQSVLGHGEAFGIWETPEAMIGGRRLFNSQARIDLRGRLVAYLPDRLQPSAALDVVLDEAVLQMTRYALLLRLGPAGMNKRKGSTLDCTSLISIMQQYLPNILARCISRHREWTEPSKAGLLRYLTADDLIELTRNNYLGRELKRMRMLSDLGFWHDAPPKPDITRTTSPKGEQAAAAPQRETIPYPPIPDDYLAEMGPRVLWLVQDLGPNLIHLFEAVPDIIAGVSDGATKQRRLASYFKRNTWCDRNGRAIMAPPFPLRIGTGKGRWKSVGGGTGNPHEWPPRTWENLQILAVTLQAAHLWITLLAMGGRLSEIDTLKRDCVEWKRDGRPYANGKTYKLSANLAGTDRDWPAPDALIHALGQQARLVAAWEGIARASKGIEPADGEPPLMQTDHLWASLGSSGLSNPENRLAGINNALQTLARRIGLSNRPGGKLLHAHRFRKTIARLAGIAIVDSPRVLMRLLGHKDIEMTLHYILTDKALQADIERVARELRIMRCQGVLEDIHAALNTPGSLKYGGHGGGGAPGLADMVRTREEELHREGKEWNAESSYELAVILTGNGHYFRVTRPGVLCLKPARATSPCTCDSNCENRIEEKTARRDILEVIPILIDEGKRALAENHLLLIADKVQQLDEDLARFEDIAAQYRNHPDVVLLREAVA